MLDHLWSVIESDVPSPLAGPQQRRDLAVLTQHLPIEGHLGFECRLGHEQDRVDIAQAFKPAGLPNLQKHAIAEGCPGNPLWLELARNWHRLDPATAGAIRYLWLEYDRDRTIGETLEQPSVLIEPLRGNHSPDHAAWFRALEGLAGLLGARVPPQSLETLSAVADTLPADFRLGTCGFMLARRGCPLRLLIRAPSAQAMAAFLLARGLPALENDAIAPLIDAFPGPSPVLSLDVGAGPRPGIGLEFPLGKLPDAEPAGRFLDELEGLGLCSTDKRRAIERFPIVIEAGSRHPWPAAYVREAFDRAGPATSRVVGQVYHVKLQVRNGRPAGAKLYFGFSHVLQSAAGATE